MKTSSDWDWGVTRLAQRMMMEMQQSNIPVASQNDQDPPPGPSPAIQPIGNSALFHIR